MLGAAFAAALAFACLALSLIEGVRRLSVLSAAGEVLSDVANTIVVPRVGTAGAILVVVPDVGVWLERGPPAARVEARGVASLRATRTRSIVALVLAGGLVAVGLGLGRPQIDTQVAALDARTIPALAT